MYPSMNSSNNFASMSKSGKKDQIYGCKFHPIHREATRRKIEGIKPKCVRAKISSVWKKKTCNRIHVLFSFYFSGFEIKILNCIFIIDHLFLRLNPLYL